MHLLLCFCQEFKNIKMSIEGDTQFEIICFIYSDSNLVTIIDFFSYILIACKQIMQQISINYCFHEPYEDVLVDLHNFVSLNRKQTFAICLSLIPIQVRVPY